LEDQITIRVREQVPRDFSGEANAGCFGLGDVREAPKPTSEKRSSATRAKSSKETLNL